MCLLPALTWMDAVTVSRLAKKIWREHYTKIIGPDQVDYMVSKYQAPYPIWLDMTRRGFTYDILFSEYQAIGYMSSRIDHAERQLFLSKFYIERSWRGRGLARRMLELLINRCAEDQLESIWLTVNRNNLESIATYQHLGFVVTDDVVQDIGSGYVMDDHIMRYSGS